MGNSVISIGKKAFVHLIRRKNLLTFLMLRFLPHACPGIRHYDIRIPNGFLRVLGPVNGRARCFGICLSLPGHLRIRLIMW